MTSNHKSESTTIAIAIEEGKWQYYSFSTFDEAREAVNKARSEGKAAVFYEGSDMDTPPIFSTVDEDDPVD